MKVWRLMVWDVPDRLSGLLARLGFRQTKKNPAHWWRVFNPELAADKPFAEKCRAELQAAGLKGSWSQVEPAKPTPLPRPHHPDRREKTIFDRNGFGGRLNAEPIPGTWRRKIRRQ